MINSGRLCQILFDSLILAGKRTRLSQIAIVFVIFTEQTTKRFCKKVFDGWRQSVFDYNEGILRFPKQPAPLQ
jgi:hypothetical protein